MKIILPRRVIKQPIPHINEGGDCGPCVLAGVLGYTVPVGNSAGRGGDIIKSIHRNYLTKDAVSIGRQGMIDALYKAQGGGIEAPEFLRRFGGYNAILVLPK